MAVGSAISGRCLCGKVTFNARMAKSGAGVCHCGMCQRWAAGPFLGVECARGSLEVSGGNHLGDYKSSAWASRQFCTSCGSALFWRSRVGGIDVVSAGALDDKSALQLTHEIFIEAKPAYYEFAGTRKRMTGTEFLAAFVKQKFLS